MDLGFKNNLFSLSKNKTVDLKNYGVSDNSQLITVNSDGLNFSIPREYFGKIIGTVNLPSILPSTSGWAGCKNALDFLQGKMSYIRKTITSWDVLNLQDTITTPTNAAEKIENLLPNSSLMVVFEDTNQSFDYDGQDYKTGDMFVKAFDGTIIPIKGAVEKGKYTPKGLTIKNNTATILYEWNTDNENSKDLKLETTSFSFQPAAYSINKSILSGESAEISLIENIIPIIKFYYNAELIESDKITIDKGSESYTITNKLSFDIIMEVK